MRNTCIILALLALALAGCGGAKPAATAADSAQEALTVEQNQVWQLVEMRGRAAKPGYGGQPTTLVLIPKTGTFSGFASCNRYFGDYTLALAERRPDGDLYNVVFTLRGSDSIGCPDPHMNAESRYMAALAKADQLLLTAYTMTLYIKGKEILKYEMQEQ